MPDHLTDIDRQCDALCQSIFEICEEQRQPAQALIIAKKAYDLAPHHSKAQSWLGYLLAIQDGQIQKGYQLCRQAVDSGIPDPIFYRNIGVVFVLLKNRKAAVGAFAKGLQIDKENKPLWIAWQKLGVRRKPSLGFLPREHALNRLLGQWSWKLLAPDMKEKRKKGSF